jgi:hypothetical protein
MNQVASLRKRDFFASINKRLHDGVYWGIKSKGIKAPNVQPFEGYSDSFVAASISTIRTDLDRFNDNEAKILENHGYYVTCRRITDKAPHLIRNANFSSRTPHKDHVTEQELSKLLKKSHKRLSVARLLRIR